MGCKSGAVNFLIRKRWFFFFRASKKLISGDYLDSTSIGVVRNIPRMIQEAELYIFLIMLATEDSFLVDPQIKLPKRILDRRTLMIRFLDCFSPMP